MNKLVFNRYTNTHPLTKSTHLSRSLIIVLFFPSKSDDFRYWALRRGSESGVSATAEAAAAAASSTPAQVVRRRLHPLVDRAHPILRGRTTRSTVNEVEFCGPPIYDVWFYIFFTFIDYTMNTVPFKSACIISKLHNQ